MHFRNQRAINNVVMSKMHLAMQAQGKISVWKIIVMNRYGKMLLSTFDRKDFCFR